MAKDIEDYVKGCAQCQQNKVNMQGVKVQYHPITTTAEALLFQTIALDFITKLPKSKGYNTILTITDQGCTKMALFIPCNEEIMAEQVAYQYLSSQNGWTIRTNEPVARAISPILDKCQTNGLGHLSSNSRICAQLVV